MIQRYLLQRSVAVPVRNAFISSARSTIQRRFASGEMPKLTGAADNAFNRERMATFGENYPSSNGPRNSTTTKSVLKCLSVAVPALILASINAHNLWVEHWEHWETLPPLEDRIEYDYMNIRTKKFFWGDGDKVTTRPS
ncbi:MAG: hypothetical protein Q9170_001905 [Blastenia crenularia]